VSDHLLKLMFEGGGVRAHFIRIEKTWLDVASRHNEAPEVLALLGEMSCASILFSASLKYQGSVILQIHGDGPVRLAVAECNSTLGFRSTVKMSESLEVAPGATWQQLVNQNNLGRFSVVLDPKVAAQQPYQGIVPLHQEGLAQALESYMNKSEQLPTRLWLACDGERAAGLLLQKMPEDPVIARRAKPDVAIHDEDEWERLTALAATITPEEMLKTEPKTLLHQLFWEEKPRLLEEQAVEFFCPCSREKVGRMLRTLGTDEVAEILSEQGHVEVNCDFCNSAYQFDAVDCAELFKAEHPSAAAGSKTLH
jgi:molecular chaperone Hsp33